MTDLEQVEIQIEVANTMRKLRDNAIKLMDNKLFKDVIGEGYFKEEAARLVMAKSASLAPEHEKLIDNMIYGVGALNNYLDAIVERGRQMDAAIGEHEETRDEILAEEMAQAEGSA